MQKPKDLKRLLDDHELNRIKDSEPESDEPGLLGVVDGQIQLIKPKGTGSWPLLLPRDDLEIRYHGRPITKPTVVDDLRYLEVVLPNHPPLSEFEIVIPPDKMVAFLRVTFKPGREYRLCDTQFTKQLALKAELVAESSAVPLDPTLVMAEIRAQGITENIQYDKLIESCMGLKDVEVELARGIPAIPAVDGRVEVVCDLVPLAPDASSAERIDYRERELLNSVEAGDVLAIVSPPQHGIPGTNVHGELVIPRPPKQPRLKAGRGVRMIENNTIAVAEIAGRPVFQHGTVSVNPQVVVQQNVDLSTGNIRFKGDVLVVGDVTEHMSIDAGGLVDIKGNAYHSRITAGSHVVIAKKIVGGRVMAGLNYPGITKCAVTMSRLEVELRSLATAVRRLKERSEPAVKEAAKMGDGYLIKVLLETRYSKIPRMCAQIHKLLEGEPDPSHDELQKVVEAVRDLTRHFLGFAPLNIQLVSAIDRIAAMLEELRMDLDAILDNPADIIVSYAQNVKLEATGSVTVKGKLAYDCDVVAGTDIVIAGECRSGSYMARSSIVAHTIGSIGMGVPSLAVSEEGFIRAALFHPGVMLKVGPFEYKIDTTKHNVEFRIEEGVLVRRAVRRGIGSLV